MPENRSIKDYLKLFLKGIAMGSADIVPGVSGGTIAFISGIYEELLKSISSFDAEAIRLLTKFQLAAFWKHVNGNFLVVLVSGILVSILSLAKLISYLLDNQPIQLWSFFFGLVIIASIMVAKQIKKWNIGVVIAGLIGIGVAYYVTIATPAETPNSLWFIFLSGSIAICAMILPGISGSFILLILGKYAYIIDAVKDINILVIAVFALGCVVGILSFSRVVSWLLEKHHDLAVSLLAGFMVGSLNKIWPWKIVTEYRTDSHGEQQPFLTENVMPANYLDQTGQDPLILQAIVFLVLGIAIVVILEKIAETSKKTSEAL